MDFAIRPAEERDLSKLFEIESRVFGEGGYPYFLFRQALDALGDLFFVAESEMTGVLGFTLGSLQAGRIDGWVLDLAVFPEAQGSGIGRRLARVLIDTMFEKGARTLYLHVRPSNLKAIKLYEGFGFFMVRSAPDYFGTGADRLIMRLDRAKA